MDKAILRYIPDTRETLCFRFTPLSLEECFEESKELCVTYKNELKLTEFLVYIEDGKPMFNLSGCIPKYFIKDTFKY